MSRDLDIVVWGATGFTGSLACAYLTGDQSKFHSFTLQNAAAPQDLRWAICGRNRAKLEALNTGVEIIVCEADDQEAIDKFVSRTRVVIGFAGPFVKYSDAVVASCARHGTHWCDISGEVPWQRSLIDRYGDRARATGACIVNHCGYDSVPSDLGALFTVNALKSRSTNPGSPATQLTNYQVMVGGMSGGTLQTGLAQQTHPVALSAGVDPADPFLVGGVPAAGVRACDLPVKDSKFDEAVGAWVGPFGMAEINTRVVRRSNMLNGYGPDLEYQEVMLCATEKQAAKAAKQAQNPAPPHVVQRLIDEGKLPKPGEGPSPELRLKSRFQSTFLAHNTVGESVACTVSGGDCGYEETAKMAIEAGLALVYEGSSCPGVINGGGFLTPAACMGNVLINRLQHAGIRFEVLSDEARGSATDCAKRSVAQFGKMVSKL